MQQGWGQSICFCLGRPQSAGGCIKLSTVPTVDWVLLGSGESTQGYDCDSLKLQLVCRKYLAFWQKKRVIIILVRTLSSG